MGTLGYMSPEQVRGLAVDQRSDIFSFGAILNEMVHGERAFTGDTPADTISAILNEEPPELSHGQKRIPPGLDRLIRHCREVSGEPIPVVARSRFRTGGSRCRRTWARDK